MPGTRQAGRKLGLASARGRARKVIDYLQSRSNVIRPATPMSVFDRKIIFSDCAVTRGRSIQNSSYFQIKSDGLHSHGGIPLRHTRLAGTILQEHLV